MAGKGILLDENGDLLVIGKSMVIGISEMQETGIILELTQGQIKHNPILGPNIVNLIRSKEDPLKIKRRLKIHLSMDNKDYDEIKEKIKFN